MISNIQRGFRITDMNPFLALCPSLRSRLAFNVAQCFPALYTCIYMCSAEELGFDTTKYVGLAAASVRRQLMWKSHSYGQLTVFVIRVGTKALVIKL